MQASKRQAADKVQGALAAIKGMASTQTVALQPFSPAQTAQQVSAAFGDVEVGAELAKEVFARTSGLPAFIEQVRLSETGAGSCPRFQVHMGCIYQEPSLPGRYARASAAYPTPGPSHSEWEV